ncbi:GntR family transcriptional regulator [Novosphingobium sp. 9U]|nr:GntR family transcriptional regulator [Novosphingobium sp. 9U]
MLPPESLVNQAMRMVREHITANKLKVGDVLPGEQYFANALGASRAVMREAFGALAALRLIDVGNGRRPRVAAIDGSVLATSLQHAVSTEQITVRQVWDVRRTLELRTVELAALNRAPSQAYRILRHAEAMLSANGDLSVITEQDIGFHQTIAEASGNVLFQQIVRSFEILMHVAVPTAWKTRVTDAQKQAMLDHHLAVATAIAAGDAGAAQAAMNSHFDLSIQRVI